jgi:Arc/MetJ-type ribon-helix-helix transcriptional regulator
MKTRNYSSVSLPIPLLEKVRKRIEKTGFKSVSDYVTFVLRELVVEEKKGEAFSKKDKAEIKKRLRALGYLK